MSSSDPGPQHEDATPSALTPEGAPGAGLPPAAPAAWPGDASLTGGPVPWAPAPPAAQPVAGYRYDVPQDLKNLAMLATLGIIVAGFVAPLIVFAVTSGDPAKRFAHDHARDGLNFCITWTIGAIISGVLTIIVVGLIGFLLLGVWGIWVIIAGTIQAANGEAPNYPLVPKLLR
jgi:uncharacterized Tic20 family protein